MKTLHLTLHRKWFEQILFGQKTEEYREIKPHWERLLTKKYTHISFRNGYSKIAPRMLVRLLFVRRGRWEGKSVFVLGLGQIVKKENCELWEENLSQPR